MPRPAKRTVGVVGSEAAKFTAATEAEARAAIRQLLRRADKVVSGGCHLGGIDIWAVEEARAAGLPFEEFKPAVLAWSGYRDRNLQIVEASDEVVCITVRELPADYRGMRFTSCYHCKTNSHVKSGGCWTLKQARLRGKIGRLVVVG